MNLEAYEDVIPVPRAAILQFPLELPRPTGFSVKRPETWPTVSGRLEFVRGRLWYMPPCGEEQQYVAMSVGASLLQWARMTGARFRVGGNEAGMLLGGEARAADAAVWPHTGHVVGTEFQRSPPILAVEVAGQDEQEAALREKATWYFAHGVKLVWLVLPRTREVVVLTKGGRTRRVKNGDAIPATPLLPGLSMRARDCFDQL